MAGQKKRIQVEAHIPPGVYKLIDGFEVAIPDVGSLLLRNAEDFERILIRNRGDGDWIGVLKAFSGDGTPIVCFGTGYDAITCLLSLNTSVRKGKWREDKPWEPG